MNKNLEKITIKSYEQKILSLKYQHSICKIYIIKGFSQIEYKTKNLHFLKSNLKNQNNLIVTFKLCIKTKIYKPTLEMIHQNIENYNLILKCINKEDYIINFILCRFGFNSI